MTELTLLMFLIDFIKFLNLILTTKNSYIIFNVCMIIFIIVLIIIFSIIIYLIIDTIRYPYNSIGATGDPIIDLRYKESILKKNRKYVILCKLLHIFKGQSVIYYHLRMYSWLVRYEYFKYYTYHYSFKKFIKKVIDIKFYKIDIFLLSYYHRFLLFLDSNEMRQELALIKLREQQIFIFLIKKIKKENTEVTQNVRRSKVFEDLLKNHEEYNELQEIKKIYNQRIEINNALMVKVLEKMYYLHFSNYYRKLSHLFFHYSLNIFWILTTTRVWLTDIKIKIIEPYLKEHSKYLVFQIQDNVTLMQRRNITEPFNDDITVKPLTIPYMGHSQIIVPTSNWKLTDTIPYTRLKYIYHFRVNTYSDTKWYVNRDNQVWEHFSGVGTYNKNYKGLQVDDAFVSKTHWGSSVDFTLTNRPPRPQLAKYFYGYRYIGYPERFFDYIIDIWVYYIEYIKAYLGYTVILPLEVASNIAEPLVINFSLLFLVILFNTWCVFTVLLISRRVQIMVKEYYFYFIIMFCFSISYYFLTFLEYFDHNLILSTWLYMFKLPFNFLNFKFNISNFDYLYVMSLNML